MPDNANCNTGTLDALYAMISGGVVPAGNCRSCVWEIAVICAIPRSTLASGLQENLHYCDAV